MVIPSEQELPFAEGHTMELFCARHSNKMPNSGGNSRQRWGNKSTGERHKLPAKDRLQQASCLLHGLHDSLSLTTLSAFLLIQGILVHFLLLGYLIIQVILPCYPKKSHQLHFLSNPATFHPSLAPGMLKNISGFWIVFWVFYLNWKRIKNCERKKE